MQNSLLYRIRNSDTAGLPALVSEGRTFRFASKKTRRRWNRALAEKR